ncbi:MAG: hypothetical protein ABSH34_13585 [Verrucomicrobiota bacterium]|jgi:hypothetical protein
MTYLSDLIEALRGELQQYGEMLARFDDQETLLTPNAPEEVLVKVTALEDQERVVSMTVRKREQMQRRLARCLGLPEEVDLTHILPLLPRKHQLLLRALMDENKELSARVQDHAAVRAKTGRTSLTTFLDQFSLSFGLNHARGCQAGECASSGSEQGREREWAAGVNPCQRGGERQEEGCLGFRLPQS